MTSCAQQWPRHSSTEQAVITYQMFLFTFDMGVRSSFVVPWCYNYATSVYFNNSIFVFGECKIFVFFGVAFGGRMCTCVTLNLFHGNIPLQLNFEMSAHHSAMTMHTQSLQMGATHTYTHNANLMNFWLWQSATTLFLCSPQSAFSCIRISHTHNWRTRIRRWNTDTIFFFKIFFFFRAHNVVSLAFIVARLALAINNDQHDLQESKKVDGIALTLTHSVRTDLRHFGLDIVIYIFVRGQTQNRSNLVQTHTNLQMHWSEAVRTRTVRTTQTHTLLKPLNGNFSNGKSLSSPPI